METRFQKDDIKHSKTFSDFLIEEREDMGWSLNIAAHKSGIDRKYIQYLEDGRYDKLPSGLYADKFVKRYIRALGFSYTDVLEEYGDEIARIGVNNKEALPRTVDKDLRKKRFIITPVVLRNIGITFLVILGLLYLSLKLYTVFLPPELIIEAPAEAESILTDREIEIRGSTEPESRVFINNQEIYVDEDGNFSEILPLRIGVNLIEISSSKEHSREQVVTRTVLVEKVIP